MRPASPWKRTCIPWAATACPWALQRRRGKVSTALNPALYHYIDSKEHLLNMVLTESYDTTEMTEFNALNASLVDGDGHCVYFFPRYMLNMLMHDVQRPELTQLYCVLSGEALNPEHPAHQFFAGRHMRNWEMIGSMNWIVPPSVNEEQFYNLYTLVTSAMDGIENRWLADDSINPIEEWINFSQIIFPEHEWTGFRDPTEREGDDSACLFNLTLSQRESMTN